MSGWVGDAAASEDSFPSLDNIYEEEEDSYTRPFKRDRAKRAKILSADSERNLNPHQDVRSQRNIVSDLYARTELCRPSDHDIRAQSDVTLPTENRRRKFLQLVKVCFSKDMASDCTSAELKCAAPTSDAAAPAPNAKNNDESSLAMTDDEDLPTNHFRLGISENILNDNTDDDSTYNLYASTLSKASASTKTSTIGDAILQESKLAAEMTRARAAGQAVFENNDREQEDSDNQTLSTYSYRRAYADNLTLGSAYTSNMSTITDDYRHERQVGMAEAVGPKIAIKQSSLSGPVDMDTGKPIAVTKDEESVSSFPMPPPIFRTNDASTFNLYESHQNLHRIVSFGEGEGYVDEQAAARFDSLRPRESSGIGCCSWFSSASRGVRLILIGSFIMLLVSVVSVSIGVMLQNNENEKSAGYVASSNSLTGNGGGELDIIDTLSPVPTLGPSLASMAPSVSSTTKPSLFVQVPQPIVSTSPTFQPSDSPVKSPTAKPTNKPTPKPTIQPTTMNPTPKPSNKPTPKPSNKPTPKPSNKPTPAPSNKPTSKPLSSPTPSPSAQPIVESSPTFNPSSHPSRSPTSPPSSAPTTQAPVYANPSLSYTVKIRAAQDTYIDASELWDNKGDSSRLRVDGSPLRRTIIGFDTSRLKARVSRHDSHFDNDEPRQLEKQVLEAKLRLFSIDDGDGVEVYILPNTKQWDESAVTSASLGDGVDASGGYKIGSFGHIEEYEWIEIDVTEAFTGGIRDFTTIVMASSYSDGVSFASKERASGTLAPEIVLTIAGSGTPTSSPNAKSLTYEPTVAPTKDHSHKPSQKPTQKPTPMPTVSATTFAPSKKPSTTPTTPEPTLEATSSSELPTSWEPTIDASNGVTTKTVEIDPTSDPSLCQICPSSGTLFVAGYDCSGFWRCKEGVRDQYQPCPEGTLFNNRRQVCDHPYNFTCTCNP